MAPSTYSDLGKKARDIFSKNYHFGLVKLDCKTKTKTGIEFNTAGTGICDTSRIDGSFDVKYKITEHGVTLKEKWTTDNTLSTEITAEDCITSGLKLTTSVNFAPQTGKKNAVASAAFKGNCFNSTAEVDYNGGSPMIHASTVLAHQGWLSGVKLAFDTSKKALTKTNFAVGYSNDDVVLHSHVDDGKVFGASVFHKVNNNLQVGYLMTWNQGNQAAQFGLGSVYTVDRDTSFRAKINNQGSLGLGLTHRLREGVEVTFCSNIDVKNFNQGGHKLGMGFSLEA